MELTFSPKCQRVKKTVSLPVSLVEQITKEALSERRSFNFIIEEKLRLLFAPNCLTVKFESPKAIEEESK
jgi:hypothetical protein